MLSDVDRPTAVANALAAVVTDTFEEEERPGSDILKAENTTRNRIKREVKRDKVRNLWLQRLYDGSFYIAWHVFHAVRCKAHVPSFCVPIRPYNGGELNTHAVSHLVAELSCALCTMCNAVFDALCAICELPTEPPRQPQGHTVDRT